MENVKMTRADPIASAVFDALATGEKCICELKEAIGIPQTWASYDLMMLEDLKAIQSRTVNGHRHYSLAPSRALWYVKRSLDREEPEASGARRMNRYESALEYLRPTTPHLSEFAGVLRRGF